MPGLQAVGYAIGRLAGTLGLFQAFAQISDCLFELGKFSLQFMGLLLIQARLRVCLLERPLRSSGLVLGAL